MFNRVVTVSMSARLSCSTAVSSSNKHRLAMTALQGTHQYLESIARLLVLQQHHANASWLCG